MEEYWSPKLKEVMDIFKESLYLEDTGHIEVTMATVLANRGPGDPVWLLILGSPGSGKTEPLNAMAGLPDVHATASLTVGGLLSGTSKKDYDNESSGGLLRKMGKFGVLAVKDFSSILSMNTDSRNQLLAAMREIYDGAWIRHLGTDGGREFKWEGKCGLIGAATPSLDEAYSVIAELGERYMYYRMLPVNRIKQATKAAMMAGNEHDGRLKLAAALGGLFATVTVPKSEVMSEEEVYKLVCLADLTCRARTAPRRESSGNHEITLITPPEAPTRILKALKLLHGSMQCLGISKERAWRLTEKVAMDSMPAIRSTLLYAMVNKWEVTLTELSGMTGYSDSTIQRYMEDMSCHGLVEWRLTGMGRGHKGVWAATELLHQLYGDATKVV
ncbi:MAG: hypothetical protein JW384_03843 [Nitrosomonadaceae bacterium]|nr:hypothetical protein [Nitrosomonadaceae bacterium]